MCGITGALWNTPQKALDGATLKRMVESLRHRGPDDEGDWRSEFRLQEANEVRPGVALGFRRLSIIDLAGGHQPMSNEDGSVWMVFNGEIYNYLELRRRLEGSGHQFRTRCDSEAIVHLYEDLGVECFSHLNGMFAIAIWDERKRQLVLARDRLGQKPLYYRHEPRERLLFGSELKAILQAPDVPRELSRTAIDQYLTYQYVPHPYSIYQGIAKLPPGHAAVCDASGQLQVLQYWNVDFRRERTITMDEAAEELAPLLRSSVQLRMQSDVPLGAFLSGGVDSSLIVALMQEAASEPVKTFNINFPVSDYDESKYAQQVAQQLGTDHQQFTVTPDMFDVLPKLVWHYDEPFADSSAVPTWYVSQHTRRHVTVALSGDGGDELFAGYERYPAVALSEALEHVPPLRSLLASAWWQRLPTASRQKSRLRQLLRFTGGLSLPRKDRYLGWISVFDESRRASLYSEEFLERLPSIDPARFLGDAWDRCGPRDHVTCASLADLTTYLPCDLNTKVDIASMAHSLEVRQPFLDVRVVEFAASLPIALKCPRAALSAAIPGIFKRNRSFGKRVLRKAFTRLVPKNVWNRRKMGFGVPLEDWFRGGLKGLLRDTLLSDIALQRGLFREDELRQLVDEHLDGRANHAARLWALLILELWQREWLD
ncbi:MAG: asparagine synthase (glutamine-hydrolyzing) [Planctomycetales bacterium]|nr:asparagine synthase (glutamine-hydrolyzing) [Planctomycetales bacterium]